MTIAELRQRLRTSKEEHEARFEKLRQRMEGDNPFDLYEGYPDSGRATTELKKVVAKFRSDVRKIRRKYVKAGIDDTASTDAIIDYIVWKVFDASLG